jgi:hypothetical protein
MSILGQFQFRRDTAAKWTADNPILLSGEMGIESDTAKFKIGNGTTAWNSLAYGGIKGDTGATGTTGATGATGATGSNGWSPILANVTDGERRVLRLVDWTGGTGTKPAVPTDNYIGSTGFTNLANATDIRGATGATGAAGTSPNAFTSISGNTGTLNADSSADTLAVTGANGISVAATDTPDGLVISPAYGTPSAIAVATTAAGAANAFARSDHVHGVSTAAPVALNTAAAEGTATSLARSDHVHPFPTAAQVGAASASFTTVAVSGQTSVVADSTADTLTLVAGTGITLTTDAAADSVTITGTIQAPQNTFSNVSVGTTPTPTVLQADLAADTVTINAGTGIVLTADAATDTMSIANSGVTSAVAGTGISVSAATGAVTLTNTGVTSVTAGTGISVSAATGGVTVTNTQPGYTTTTIAAPSASFSTVVTTVISQAIAGGSISAGAMYEFYVRAQVINTTAASNLVATISIGAVNVLVLTQAMGATARAAPGGAVIIQGTISFSSATAAEATARAFTSTAVAFDTASATTAAVTVATAAATTADIKLNSSAATTTVIVREAMLRRIK